MEPTETPNDEDISLQDVVDSHDEAEDLFIPFESVSVPDRDVDDLTDIFKDLNRGDKIKIRYGAEEFSTSTTGEIIGIRGPNCNRPPRMGWEYTIELLGPEGNNRKGRLYRTGIGGTDTEPWTVFSYEYYPQLNKLEEADEGLHGWVTSVDKL